MLPRAALAVVLAVGLAAAYLASHAAPAVRLTLTEQLGWDLPFAALVAAVLVAGVSAGLLIAPGAGARRRAGSRPWLGPLRRDDSVTELYRQGEEARAGGRAEAATRAYEELLRRDPDHAEAHARLAALAHERGDERGALLHALGALRVGDSPGTLLAAAEAYRRVGRPDDAMGLYRDLLARDPEHVTALRGLREVAAAEGRWADALQAQERVLALAPDGDRPAELAWLAGIHYELGRARLREGDLASAVSALRSALRARADFVPAALALGEAHHRAGNAAQALRVWERGLQLSPEALPLLDRIEKLYRGDARPTRMIALYRDALARAPDSLPLGMALGRVYYQLSMLDEAADQFQKLEARASDLPSVHAYLGAIFERHGQTAEAFDGYRRALDLTASFDWPHRCAACGARHPRWVDRCPSCGRWNAARP